MKRIIEIHDLQHFQGAVSFSEDHIKDPWQALPARIMRLAAGAYNDADRLALWPDFVRHSFSFELSKAGRRVMNGGIILHELGETFAVELVAAGGLHYAVHT